MELRSLLIPKRHTWRPLRDKWKQEYQTHNEDLYAPFCTGLVYIQPENKSEHYNEAALPRTYDGAGLKNVWSICLFYRI